MYWSRETRSIANESNAKMAVFSFPRTSSSRTASVRGAQLTRMCAAPVHRVPPMRVTPAGCGATDQRNKLSPPLLTPRAASGFRARQRQPDSAADQHCARHSAEQFRARRFHQPRTAETGSDRPQRVGEGCEQRRDQAHDRKLRHDRQIRIDELRKKRGEEANRLGFDTATVKPREKLTPPLTSDGFAVPA